MKKYYLLLVFLFLVGCASTNKELDKTLDKKVLTPEKVQIYDIKVEDILPEVNNGKKLLKGFPFVSNRAIIDFNGKFSYQFYDKIDYRYRYSSLDNVDFWKLRTNPFLYDFIYVLPIWVDDFKKVSNDLFTDIGFSYNLSTKEQEILKWWIAQGGILWIEDGIYSTRYDAFKKNGEIDEALIREKIYKKAKNLKFLNRHIYIYPFLAKRVDLVNYKPLNVVFKTYSDIKYFSDIKSLKLLNYNYFSLYFLPKGVVLLKDSQNRPLVTFIQIGKGGIVNLIDFEFEDKMYDGELLRWKLLGYFLSRKYIDDIPKVKIKNETQKKIDLTKEKLIMHLNFRYKSYELTPKAKEALKPMIKYLKQHPQMKIKIVGHTDSIGSYTYNDILSLKRANAVKEELVKNGIEPNRLVVEGKGEREPIATNMIASGRAKNRRVEFILIK